MLPEAVIWPDASNSNTAFAGAVFTSDGAITNESFALFNPRVYCWPFADEDKVNPTSLVVAVWVEKILNPVSLLPCTITPLPPSINVKLDAKASESIPHLLPKLFLLQNH